MSIQHQNGSWKRAKPNTELRERLPELSKIVYRDPESEKAFREWPRAQQGVQPNRRNEDRSHIDPKVEAELMKRIDLWRRGTKGVSSSTQKFLHPAFIEIVGFGPDAVPIILRELQKAPSHLVSALRFITRVHNLISEDDVGDIIAMTDTWLNWGRTNGYIA